MKYEEVNIDELKSVMLSGASHVSVELRPKVLALIDRIEELEESQEEMPIWTVESVRVLRDLCKCLGVKGIPTIAEEENNLKSLLRQCLKKAEEAR